MSETDSLDFIRDIRITQFWRAQLGDDRFQNFDTKDLRRWYEAMDLRGTDDLRGYITERNCRYPRSVVTGLVAKPPHPPLELVQIWLEAHESRSYTGTALMSVMAFCLGSFVLLTNLNGCQNAKAPNQLAKFLPPAATLVMAGNNGVPAPISTMPTSLPGLPGQYVLPVGVSVQGFQPNTPGLTAQNRSPYGPGGSSLGIGSMSSPSSVSSGMPGLPTNVGGQGGLSPGAASPGPSAFGASSTASAPSMHSASSGNSTNLPGLSKP